MQLLGGLLYVLCVVHLAAELGCIPSRSFSDLKVHLYKLMLQWKRCDGTHGMHIAFHILSCHTCLCNTFGLEY